MIYWIDTAVGVAYVRVLGALSHFPELLTVFDRIFADPRWRPDMPIVEDVREMTERPPLTCVEEWRAYLRERGPRIAGVRWAIVAPATDEALRAVLDQAAADAAVGGVTIQVFSRMLEAHDWLGRGEPSWWR
jgi:hypothetical protein